MREIAVSYRAYLEIIKANLAGQTAFRVDSAFASQTQIINGFNTLIAPDLILRENNIRNELLFLSQSVGAKFGTYAPINDIYPFPIAAIYDHGIENMIRDIYRRDYLNFGFRNWDEDWPN